MIFHISMAVCSLIQLPTEIKSQIFDYLPIKDQYSLGITSSDFYGLYANRVKKNPIYKDERDFKRFKYYRSLNHYHIERRSIISRSLDFYDILDQNYESDYDIPTNNFFYHIQILFGSITLILSAKTESLRLPCSIYCAVNLLNHLYKSYVIKEGAQNQKDATTRCKNLMQNPQSKVTIRRNIKIALNFLPFMFSCLTLVDLVKIHIAEIEEYDNLFLPPLPLLNAAGSLIHGIERTFYYTDHANYTPSYDEAYIKTSDFFKKYETYNQHTKVYFYPYTEKGRKLITYMKRVSETVYVLQWLSLLYILYGFYQESIVTAQQYKIKTLREKAALIFKLITAHLKTYQALSEIFSSPESTLILKYYLDHCITLSLTP